MKKTLKIIPWPAALPLFIIEAALTAFFSSTRVIEQYWIGFVVIFLFIHTFINQETATIIASHTLQEHVTIRPDVARGLEITRCFMLAYIPVFYLATLSPHIFAHSLFNIGLQIVVSIILTSVCTALFVLVMSHIKVASKQSEEHPSSEED